MNHEIHFDVFFYLSFLKQMQKWWFKLWISYREIFMEDHWSNSKWWIYCLMVLHGNTSLSTSHLNMQCYDWMNQNLLRIYCLLISGPKVMKSCILHGTYAIMCIIIEMNSRALIIVCISYEFQMHHDVSYCYMKPLTCYLYSYSCSGCGYFTGFHKN